MFVKNRSNSLKNHASHTYKGVQKYVEHVGHKPGLRVL